MKKSFMKLWDCRDLGPVKEYLGMKIVRDRKNRCLYIDQNAYALKVVNRFGMRNTKSTRVVLPTGYSQEANEGQCTPEQRTYYQSIIGSLLYLALGTRPDITYAVIMMSQFSANPSETHITKALHIVRYVASTLSATICYDGSKQGGDIIAYADADHANDKISRRSVTGYCILLGKGVVSWNSCRQPTRAHSSTESEYMALSDCSRQISWIGSLLEEIGYPRKTIDLCGDNQGSIFSASNPSVDKRLKHIDIRYHYIKECVELKKIRLHYVPTSEQIADLLTKNLSADRVQKLITMMGMKIKDNR